MKINTEKEFNTVVKEMGGTILSEEIECSPNYANADYIFHNQKIVAELKCLEENKQYDSRMQNKLRRLWIKWKQAGFVHGKVPHIIYSQLLPEHCAEEMRKVTGEPIRRQIKKANRQLRETKKHLNLTDYKGLLLLGNIANSQMLPAALVNVAFNSIKNDFREISSFIVFTLIPATSSERHSKPTLFWVHGYHDNDSSIDTHFIDNLHTKWASHLETVLGSSFQIEEMEDMQAFWQSQYYSM